MSTLLGIICFIGFFGGLILLVVHNKQGKPIKMGVSIMVASVVITAIGVSLSPPPSSKALSTPVVSNQISNDTSETIKKDEQEAKEIAEAEAKAEADAKAKAEAEEKAKKEAEEKVKAEEEARKKAEETSSANIGMNAEQFKASFNKASKSVDSDLKIGNLKVEDGPAMNTFQHNFTQNLSLIGTVNKKDGLINSLTFIGVGDGSLKSGADIILSIGLSIMATNPELSADDRGNVLRELGLTGNEDMLNLEKETIRNGIKYSIKTSKELGIWFFISDANE